VHDPVNRLLLLNLLLENAVQELDIHDVALLEADPLVHVLGVEFLRQNLDHAIQHIVKAVRKIVQDYEIGVG